MLSCQLTGGRTRREQALLRVTGHAPAPEALVRLSVLSPSGRVYAVNADMTLSLCMIKPGNIDYNYTSLLHAKLSHRKIKPNSVREL